MRALQDIIPDPSTRQFLRHVYDADQEWAVVLTRAIAMGVLVDMDLPVPASAPVKNTNRQADPAGGQLRMGEG